MRHEAIYKTHPEVKSITESQDGNWICLDGGGNSVVLDESKISTEQARLQAEWDAQSYARDRITAYPSIGDQLDYIYHNGMAKWKTDMIDPVKTKYSKG